MIEFIEESSKTVTFTNTTSNETFYGWLDEETAAGRKGTHEYWIVTAQSSREPRLTPRVIGHVELRDDENENRRLRPLNHVGDGQSWYASTSTLPDAQLIWFKSRKEAFTHVTNRT